MSFADNTFYKRITGLLGVRIVGAFIVLLSAPIITRTYLPEQYGQWVIWFSLSLITASIASLGYAHSIVLPKHHKHGALLLVLSIMLCILVSTSVALIYWSTPKEWLSVFGIPQNLGWTSGLCVMVMLTGFNECIGSWCVRRERFTIFAISQCIIAAGVPITQIVLANLVKPTVLTLIGGSLVGQFVSVIVLFYSQSRDLSYYTFRNRAPFVTVLLLAKRYRVYPQFIVARSLIATLRERFVFFMLGIANKSAAGFYGLAVRMVNVPNNLIASSIKPVFYQIASTRDLKDMEGEVQVLMLATVRILIPVWVLFVHVSEDLFAIIFGENWRIAGYYAAIISFSAIPHILGNWVDRIFDVTSNQKLVFQMEGMFSILAICAVSIGYATSMLPQHIIIIHSGVLSLYFYIYLYQIYRVANYSLRNFWSVIMQVALLGVSCALMYFLMEQLWGSTVTFIVYSIVLVISTIVVVGMEYKRFKRTKASISNSC